jgi:hypothetical protein
MSTDSNVPETRDYTLPHPIWPNEYLDNVQITHHPPQSKVEWAALATIKIIRFNFDWMSGFIFGKRTEKKWLKRILFLETVAAVPGSIAGTLRHLASLRRLSRDRGWIHTLLEEAENERMHLLTALVLLKPGTPFRGFIWVTQGVFFNFFWVAYLISPRFCHRMVGYLEEEAVKTYTELLKDIDSGPMQHWQSTVAPAIARKYWKLDDNASMREVIAMIRADEAHHRLVNHKFAELTEKPDAYNPFAPGE